MVAMPTERKGCMLLQAVVVVLLLLLALKAVARMRTRMTTTLAHFSSTHRRYEQHCQPLCLKAALRRREERPKKKRNGEEKKGDIFKKQGNGEQNMERAGKRISFYEVGVKITTRSKQCNGNVLCRQGSVISLPNRTAVLLVRYGAVICGGPPVTMLALSELLLKL